MMKRAREVVEELRRLATAKDHANLARFGIVAPGEDGAGEERRDALRDLAKTAARTARVPGVK